MKLTLSGLIFYIPDLGLNALFEITPADRPTVDAAQNDGLRGTEPWRSRFGEINVSRNRGTSNESAQSAPEHHNNFCHGIVPYGLREASFAEAATKSRSC